MEFYITHNHRYFTSKARNAYQIVISATLAAVINLSAAEILNTRYSPKHLIAHLTKVTITMKPFYKYLGAQHLQLLNELFHANLESTKRSRAIKEEVNSRCPLSDEITVDY
uniref:Uncharacterized protein n=1 Tax=Glossina pallidipes TaxID=7398 RepID=A0A1A9ZGZ6_GLOPL